MAKLRDVPAAIDGPPKGPAGFRVSKTRQGATVTNRMGVYWVMMKVWPATMKVAERSAPVPLAATVKSIAPLPVPLAPEVIVIHQGKPVTVHAQPAAAVTEIVPECAASS